MIGSTLGHYRILDRLGTGGMGVVWLAEDLELGRRVAIKMLRDDVAASPEKRARFEREARSVAALNHPNIVTLFAVEEAEGERFIAMEYVEGRTLDDRLEEGPLPASEVLRVGIGVAAALDEAHRHGIVHRDLKPSNVLLGSDGRIKVVDFGLARNFSSDSLGFGSRPRETSLTQEGLAVGTLHYMSPEQLQNRQVDQRTDLFALGIVLYEMATGKMPFPGESAAQVISSVLRDPPRRMDGAGTKLPPQVLDLVDALLAKDPDERPASAAEVRQALEAAQQLFTSETSALPASRSSRARRPAAAPPRRRYLPYLLAAALVAVLAVGLAVMAPSRHETTPRAAAAARSMPTLAVLPLRSFDNRPDYFVDGMTDELISALARLGGVRVISRQSSMRYKGSDKLLGEIGRELGVDYLVEGSISQDGDLLRLQATVLKPDPEQSLWADAFEVPAADVLALHQRTARAIAQAIDVEAAVPARPAATVDPATFDRLLRAQYLSNLLTAEDLEKSTTIYRQALESDSRFAPAWAGIALNSGLLGFFGKPAGAAATESERAARRALELDPALPEAHAALGFVLHFFRWDWDGAEREYRRALELNPNDASSHHRLWALLAARGRWDEAARELDAARRLDPLSVSIAANYGQHLALRGDYEGGLRELRRASNLEPASGVPYMHLWWIEHTLGRDAEAGDALVRGLRAFGLVDAANVAEGTLATAGYHAAVERAAEAAARQAAETDTMAYNVAEMFAAAGRFDESINWLRRGFVAHAPEMPWIAVARLFDPLRERPEFRELIRGLQLAPHDAARAGG